MILENQQTFMIKFTESPNQSPCIFQTVQYLRPALFEKRRIDPRIIRIRGEDASSGGTARARCATHAPLYAHPSGASDSTRARYSCAKPVRRLRRLRASLSLGIDFPNPCVFFCIGRCGGAACRKDEASRAAELFVTIA